VLILQWDVHFASLIPALLRARFHGVPTILWGHGYSKQESSWRSALRSQIAKMATALLFYNFGAAQKFINEGWIQERIFVAINSLDQTPINLARESWLQDPDRLAAFRQEQKFLDGPIMLYVSRLDPDNRVELGIRAVHRLQESFPHLQFVVIGKGESERSRLEQLAQELGVEQRIRFVDAIYDENELAPWFLSADVFCYPANIGLSLLHAFGYGLPVVTSDRVESQNPEIEALRDGENGLLYTDGSVDSLSDAITKILADEALARRMSQTARQTVAEDFSLQRMVDGIVDSVTYCSKTRSKR
jgi:glycosyltransferase involved in cell wall biosynthesis